MEGGRKGVGIRAHSETAARARLGIARALLIAATLIVGCGELRDGEAERGRDYLTEQIKQSFRANDPEYPETVAERFATDYGDKILEGAWDIPDENPAGALSDRVNPGPNTETPPPMGSDG